MVAAERHHKAAQAAIERAAFDVLVGSVVDEASAILREAAALNLRRNDLESLSATLRPIAQGLDGNRAALPIKIDRAFYPGGAAA